MGYEIRIVSNEEFNALPYKNVRNSFGLADAKNNVAYVRETGVRGLDMATIEHEFDELVSKISPHEEDGIRYKSGKTMGQIFAPVLGAVLAPFTGGTSLWWVPAAAGAALGAGTSVHSSLEKPEKYGPVSFGNVALPAVTGAAGGFGGAQAMSGAMAGAEAAKSAGTSQLMGGLKGAIGMTPAGAASTTPAGYTGTVTIPGQQAAVPASQAISAASKAGTGLAGTGLMGSGTQLVSQLGKTGSAINQAVTAKSAENVLNTFGNVGKQETPSLYPELRTSASNVGKFEEGVTSGALSRFLPGTQTEYTLGSDYAPAVTQEQFNVGRQNIAKNQAQRIQSIMEQFRLTRPGATPGKDTALTKALGNVNRSSEAELEALRSEATSANTKKQAQYQNVQRYNEIKKLNNLSDAQMKTYIDLAKKSDQEIAAAVANTPNEFRSIFGSLTAIG